MRDGMVVLPMLMGCGSPSSLEVLNPTPTKPKPDQSAVSRTSKKQEKTEESLLGKIPTKKSRRHHSFPKADIAGGIHKLIQRSSKSFSQVFVYKHEGDEDEDEDEDMEIGAPTDVKHVTHIGIGECDAISSFSINNISAAYVEIQQIWPI